MTNVILADYDPTITAIFPNRGRAESRRRKQFIFVDSLSAAT
jgi:hypothetical protein